MEHRTLDGFRFITYRKDGWFHCQGIDRDVMAASPCEGSALNGLEALATFSIAHHMNAHAGPPPSSVIRRARRLSFMTDVRTFMGGFVDGFAALFGRRPA